MGFKQDAAIIADIVEGRDPSFSRVLTAVRNAALGSLRSLAETESRDAFLLEAMRVVSLAGNGHSRVIPNPTIRVAPYRIVMRDDRACLVMNGAACPIASVNGVTPTRLMSAWGGLLAGTSTRRHMLSGVMMAWPSALRVAGIDTDRFRYALENGCEIVWSADDLVAASSLYPVSDPGFLDPERDDHALSSSAMVGWHDGLWRLRIADLKNVAPTEFEAIVDRMKTDPNAGAVVDLRGNTGGDYTKAWPLIDWLASEWRGQRCAVLVNGYTFSAAIVLAALLVHRLGPRVRLFGSQVGDDLVFYAEGSSRDLPQSGALLRYSSAWHDWQTGRPDKTTEPLIARDMVGIGALDILPVSEAAQIPTAVAFAKGG